MNEEQARAIDIGIRAIAGATFSVESSAEMEALLTSRRTLERMLSEGFAPCPGCGRLPATYTMLEDRSDGLLFDGWCALCGCPRNAYGRSLDDVREEWNKEVGPE